MKITTSESIKSCKMKNQGSWKHYQCRMKIIFYESTRGIEWKLYPWKALLKMNESISSRALKKMNEIIKKSESTRSSEWNN